MTARTMNRRIRHAFALAALSVVLMGCGYKGPLVAADPAAPADKSVETSRVPDASSAAPPAAQDADRVIDEGDADTSEQGDDAP